METNFRANYGAKKEEDCVKWNQSSEGSVTQLSRSLDSGGRFLSQPSN